MTWRSELDVNNKNSGRAREHPAAIIRRNRHLPLPWRHEDIILCGALTQRPHGYQRIKAADFCALCSERSWLHHTSSALVHHYSLGCGNAGFPGLFPALFSLAAYLPSQVDRFRGGGWLNFRGSVHPIRQPRHSVVSGYLASTAGFEPAAHSLEGCCSVRLSYVEKLCTALAAFKERVARSGLIPTG